MEVEHHLVEERAMNCSNQDHSPFCQTKVLLLLVEDVQSSIVV